MTAPSPLAFLTVAGGRGSRAGEGIPKQYRSLLGETLLARTLKALHAAAPQAVLLTVIHADDRALYEASVAELPAALRDAILPPAIGGASRQTSVRNGLEALQALEKPPEIVLIHDAARPFADAALIARAIDAARGHGAAAPGVPLADTVKEIDAAGRVVATPERARLRAVQTPQAFDFDLILKAHRAAASHALEFTDDAMVAESSGHAVHIFEGDPGNFKLTSREDFLRAESVLINSLPDIRTGQGYDVHAFAAGDHVWLGGVSIPHDHGLAGHSDADVLAHAVTDAILGAIADGDIGSHFPPSDPQWKGAKSSIFLEYAADLVRRRGGMIAHIDATIVCEAPKIGPHRETIRLSLAEIMGVDLDRVAVKATTSERLGFTGAKRGWRRWPSRPSDCRDRLMRDAHKRALARELLDLARKGAHMIATAESCTGGLVAGAITDLPGASEIFDRGFVTYSNAAKVEMLGVRTETLDAHGAVSRETAIEMAEGALKFSGATLAVSITGIAGPEGGSTEKPVGLVHFACAGPHGARHVERRFGPLSRDGIRAASVAQALEMLIDSAQPRP